MLFRSVAFTHLNSIGSAEDIDPVLTWERGASFVRGTRVAHDLSPSRGMLQRGIDYRMDVKKVMTFTPPCHVVIDITRTEAHPAPGQAPRIAAHHMIINSMTPETESSCHYFWANARDHDLDNAQMTALALRQTGDAFAEDKLKIGRAHV